MTAATIALALVTIAAPFIVAKTHTWSHSTPRRHRLDEAARVAEVRRRWDS